MTTRIQTTDMVSSGQAAKTAIDRRQVAASPNWVLAVLRDRVHRNEERRMTTTCKDKPKRKPAQPSVNVKPNHLKSKPPLKPRR